MIGLVAGLPHRLARQVTDVVARRMENRLELRNQLFRALTPAQRKTYVETLRGTID